MNNDQNILRVTPGISEKVEFLKNKNNYPESTKELEVRETHMSWVFLTDKHVYKLKKPVRYNSLDLRMPESRHRNCEQEIILNRRLARDIYLEVVPLILNKSGKLSLGGTGIETDWLIKMKRLPRERMLDYIIKHGIIHKPSVLHAAETLSKFYKQSLPAETDTHHYLNLLKKRLIANQRELLRKEYGLSKEPIKQILSRQLNFIESHHQLFEIRVRKGRIVEAHGDLKPEHICLTEPPVFIDCLEFSREFRILDIADELSYLYIECEMLGAPEIGDLFFDVYLKVTDDKIHPAISNFYKSKQAFLRSKFAIWHIREARYRDDPKWLVHTNKYLQLAGQYGDLLAH